MGMLDDFGTCFIRQLEVRSGTKREPRRRNRLPVHKPKDVAAILRLWADEGKRCLLNHWTQRHQMRPHCSVDGSGHGEKRPLHHYFPSRKRSANPTTQFKRLAPFFGSAVGRHSPSAGAHEKTPHAPPNGGWVGA